MLLQTADAVVGGKDTALIVDEMALPKQSKHSVDVKRQHCGVLDKQANIQARAIGTMSTTRMLIASKRVQCTA